LQKYSCKTNKTIVETVIKIDTLPINV